MKVYGWAAILALALVTVGCSQSNHFVYAVGSRTNSVLGFRAAGNGTLTVLSAGFPTDAQPVSMVLNPAAPFAYTANFSGDNVSALVVDTTNGTMKEATDPVTGDVLLPQDTEGNNPVALGISANGQFLYVLDQAATPVLGSPGKVQANITIFAIDGENGGLDFLNFSPVGTPAGTVSLPVSLAVAPNSSFLYVADLAQAIIAGFTINSDGSLTPMPSTFTAGPAPTFLTIDPQSKFLYVADQVTNQIFAFTIDPSTGALSPVSGSPFAAGSVPVCLAMDSAGVFLVSANSGSNNISAYSVNTTTGALTEISGSPFTTGTTPVFVIVDATNSFVYVADSASDDIAGFAIANGTLKSIVGSPFVVATSPGWLVSR
jgi:6-phosphogluconolactonase